MKCELFPDKAPKTVDKFDGLATGKRDWTNPSTGQKVHGKPLYDGVPFHRVIPGFMVQSGDPMGTGMGNPGYSFKTSSTLTCSSIGQDAWPWPTPAPTPTVRSSSLPKLLILL